MKTIFILCNILWYIFKVSDIIAVEILFPFLNDPKQFLKYVKIKFIGLEVIKDKKKIVEIGIPKK